MGQRSKVLDTDGPTPKFLFAILKQLDLKAIDWNKVAAELEISNGHAARMRYSRFRNQMEGPLGNRGAKKKNAKKAKGDPKAEMQAASTNPQPVVVPKTEPMDSSFASSPHVKFEPSTQPVPMDQPFYDSPEPQQVFQPMTHTHMASSQHTQSMSLEAPYAVFPGMPSSMSPPMPPPMPYSSSFPFGHSYPTCISEDISMADFSIPPSALPNASVINWGPPPSAPVTASTVVSTATATGPHSTPIKIEDEDEVVEQKIDVTSKMNKAVTVKVEKLQID